MSSTYLNLGVYSDLVQAALASRKQPPTNDELLDGLQFSPWKAEVRVPTRDAEWEKDGIRGEAVSWSAGYGPRTEAWIFRRSDAKNFQQPGIVLLHDHGAFKYWGKEKVADGPAGMAPGLASFRKQFYGERSLAEALARAGFTVLVHDVFPWGSRRIPYETIPAGDRDMGELLFADQCKKEGAGWQALPEEVRRYNTAAHFNEHTVAKITTVLGTCLAGIISFEDRLAAAYLHSRTDICDGWVGCIGLSGGGLRSALLRGTSPEIRAAVIVGMMSTYAGLLDRHVPFHTWMLYPPAWAGAHDWPDVVARRFDIPVLVQYDQDDELFSAEGMTAADKQLREAFAHTPRPENYRGELYPGPHKFDLPMQEAAFAWLKKTCADRDKKLP
jgi:dienelactone hydrolase